ncbi:hypothetical protein ACGF0D_38885 [Kitasatospora sp. NPDC048298]|uniref:hypothetical protein n=1 Tax=Kitasatospora sp. NPDC048298 TaxID=3364049 RepID=UPI003724C06E
MGRDSDAGTTWRQFRTQAIVGAIACAVGSLYLLVLGISIHGDYADTLSGCIASGCAPGLVSGFEGRYDTLVTITGLLLTAVPALLGVFWGAPLISTELAAGTHRSAWHQSVTRTRWLTVKPAVVGLASDDPATRVITSGLPVGRPASPPPHRM